MLPIDIREPGAFVGRDRELNALNSALSAALSGRGRVVVLTGDPGIGKTRTALELASHAETKGARALWGRCYEGQGAPPCWPWIQIIRTYLQGRDSDQLRLELGIAASDIAGVVPEVREIMPDVAPLAAPDPEQARFRFFDSMASFLERVSRHQSLVIILDDLHWADPPSLLLLEFLAQNLLTSSILILGTSRDIGLSRQHPLVSTLGGLTRQPNFLRLPLGGIGPAAIRSLIRSSLKSPPPEEIVRELYTRSQGNPLFLTEMVRLLKSEHEVNIRQGGEELRTLVPEGVKDVIRQRLGQLSEDCCRALTIASVIGSEFDPILLDVLMEDNSLERITALLEEAESARLIEESPDAVGRYRFTHVLIQETLLNEMATIRRAYLHRHIAESIEKTYPAIIQQHASEIVHHLALAAPVSDASMLVQYALIAGEQALAAYAYENAVDYFQQALVAKEGDVSAETVKQAADTETAAILFGLGKALGATGRVRDGWVRLEHAFDFYFQSDDARNAVAVAQYPIFFVPGLDNATRMASRALTLVPPDSLEAGHLLARYGMLLNLETGDYQQAQEVLEKALLIAQGEGDLVLEIQALTNAADVDWYHTRWGQVIDKCERAIQLAVKINRPDLEIWPHYPLATSYWYSTTDRKIALNIDAALELSEKVRNRGFLAMSLTLKASLEQCKGEWETARAILKRSLNLSPEFFYPLCRHVALEFELGDFEQGQVYLERLIGVMRKTPPGPVGEYTIIPSTIAHAAYVSGDCTRFDIAREAARTVLSSPGLPPIVASDAYIGLGYLGILENDTEVAREQYGNLKSLNMVFMDDANSSMPRLLGLLAKILGQPQVAARHFDDALALCRECGHRPELAWVCYEYVNLLSEARAAPVFEEAEGWQKGKALLEEGLALAEELDMKPLLSRFKYLEKLYSSQMIQDGGKSASDYPDGLTQREGDVLRLMAAGKSNQQIADELFISVHTVIYHVRNIFSKTGASNRVGAAAYAVQHRLAP